jgi:hypothetical protein
MEWINYIIVFKCMILKNVFIYFLITIYIIAWGGGEMVNVLGCGWKGESSNFTLDMLCSWHYHDNLL